MTNAIVILVVTNWVQIGTFDEYATGKKYLVQEGRTFTNTVGTMEHEGQKVNFIFKSEPGPTNQVWRITPTGTSGPMPPPPLPVNEAVTREIAVPNKP